MNAELKELAYVGTLKQLSAALKDEECVSETTAVVVTSTILSRYAKPWTTATGSTPLALVLYAQHEEYEHVLQAVGDAVSDTGNIVLMCSSGAVEERARVFMEILEACDEVLAVMTTRKDALY